MPIPAALPIALAAGSQIGSMFAKKPSYEESPEVKQARAALASFMTTGRLGDYQAGADYSGSLGDYNMAGIESMGQTRLGELMGSALPYMDETAGNLRDLINGDKYNPMNDLGAYRGFSDLVDLATKDAMSATKRAAAYGGNLYSSGAMKALAKVAEQGQAQKSAKLADLYQSYINSKINAIPQLGNLGQTMEAMNLGRIGASQQYGGLQRLLNTSRDQAYYQDFLRKQQERQGQVGAAQAVMGGGGGTVDPGSSWNKVLDTMSGIGGNMLGQQYGSYLQNQNNMNFLKQWQSMMPKPGGN